GSRSGWCPPIGRPLKYLPNDQPSSHSPPEITIWFGGGFGADLRATHYQAAGIGPVPSDPDYSQAPRRPIASHLESRMKPGQLPNACQRASPSVYKTSSRISGEKIRWVNVSAPAIFAFSKTVVVEIVIRFASVELWFATSEHC